VQSSRKELESLDNLIYSSLNDKDVVFRVLKGDTITIATATLKLEELFEQIQNLG